MAAPPKDANGYVEPHDDPQTIPDDSHVIRYIHTSQLVKCPDGTRRLSSGAFSKSNKSKDRYEGMSVDMHEAMIAKGVDPESRMPPDHEGAVLIQAAKLRELGLEVGPDPTEDNPFHASVWGVKRSDRKKIKACCEWLIKPSDIE